MSSRDTILQRLRTELSKSRPADKPEPAEVWPRENPAPAEMADRFTEELTLVHGEVIRCASVEDAQRRLAELAKESEWKSLCGMDRPMVRDAAGGLPPDAIEWAAADWQPRRIADYSASVIEADALLADTGSCLISCPTAQDRLLCYLPPACVVIARVGQLAEHLPAAWPSVVARASEQSLTGEFVIVTGPSRTADIEKILILGVHGPKRLVVLLIG
ncbi:MAG: LUD domain-containing protein [Pirellulaceae bacterium]|nr:LUD domain-containing protein [Pirellulaceae bacterium]